MPVGHLIPESFGGNDIQSTVYRARFVQPRGGFAAISGTQAQAIETQIPEGFSKHVYGQPQSKLIPMEIEILPTVTQANIEQMKKWFDPLNGEQYLVASDNAAVNRRIAAFPESIQPSETENNWRVVLRCAVPVWEANTATADTLDVTSSGATDTLTNAGNTRTYPTFTITPNTVMADTNSWIKRIRVHIANKSENPYSDPIGDGWPVDLTNNAWDTDALNTASKVLSTLNDVRVINGGAEINRWMDPATDNATTKTWVNMQMRPRKIATLAANIDDNDTSLTVDNATGLRGWPTTGFFLLGTERIQYGSRTQTSMASLTRGSGNTTAAAHTAGDILYWVEHPFLNIIYHYDNAGDPLPPDDRKPRIDLANSTNTSFKWADAFLNAGDRRSAGWQPQLTDNGFTTRYIGLYEVGGNLRFQDVEPSVSKPNWNNIYVDVPPGVVAGSNISFDEVIQINMRLNLYAIDVGGNEVLVASYCPDQNTAAETRTLQLTDNAYRIRFNGRIGVLLGTYNFVGSGSVPVEGISTDSTEPDSLSFVVDEDDVPIISIAVNIGGTWQVYENDINAFANFPLFGTLGGGQRYHLGFETTSGSLRYGIVDDDGDYAQGLFTSETSRGAHGTVTQTFGDDDLRFRNAAESARGSRYYYAIKRENLIQYDSLPLFRLLTDGEHFAQIDAPVKTEEYISLNNITLPFDSTRTPEIVFAAEEVLYLMNARLKNDSTGDYLDIFYPMKLGQNIVIECGAKRVVDGETGVDIPFVVSASNPSEWIYLAPGANTISYTEVGVVSTTLAHSFRSRWQ